MPKNEHDPRLFDLDALMYHLYSRGLEETPIDDNAEIVSMPSRYLKPEERKDLSIKLFPLLRDQVDLLRNEQFNQEAMQKSDAIIVDLGRSRGFIGDVIQDSRLVEILEQRYPGQVFVKTDNPGFFGKNRHVTAVDTNFLNLTLKYRKNIDSSEEKMKAKSVFFVRPRILNTAHGELKTARRFRNFIRPSIELELDRVENTHMLHVAQVMWEFLYGGNIDSLPEPALRISEKDAMQSQKVFDTLPISNSFNIIIHPDAYKKTYPEKKWTTEKWVELINELKATYPDIGIFISRGVDHPEASTGIMDNLRTDQSVYLLPQLPLAQYAGLLDTFSKDKTIFVGLESMAASHLAPSLGLKSIALSSVHGFCLYYGPWNGMVVASTVNVRTGSIAAINVDRVTKAIETLKQRKS